MPFQDDPTIRPLFDRHEGGGPVAWMCILCNCVLAKTQSAHTAPETNFMCRKITKTLDGMRKHQEQVHGYTPQVKLDDKKDTVDTVDPLSL